MLTATVNRVESNRIEGGRRQFYFIVYFGDCRSSYLYLKQLSRQIMFLDILKIVLLAELLS